MKILYIDDEKNALKDFEYECKKIEGIEDIYLCNNVKEGKKVLENNDIDVLFLDINMPEITGTEFAKKALSITSRIKIVFVTAYDQYAIEAINNIHPEGYILKPITSTKIKKVLGYLKEIGFSGNRIMVKTFGNFDIYVDDKKIKFKRSFSKEILAYLIDKKGSSVSRKELAASVFDLDDYSRKTQININQYIYALKNTLDEYNIGQVLNNSGGLLSVNMSMMDIDFINFINGDKKARRMYKGEYMTSYSWGEPTSSYLDRILQNNK